jgi:CS domain
LATSTNVQREYPSAAFISPQAAVVADGNGFLYVIPIRDNDVGPSQPVGVFTLPTGVPFRLHHLHRAGPTTIVLLLSSRYYSEELQNKPGSVAFDIWAVKVDLFSLRSTGVSEPRPLEASWHRRGEDVPLYTTFVDKLNAHLIIGGSSYRDPETQKLASPYEPTPDEIVPIPRANENLEASLSDQDKKLYPYSWTQSSDSVTVAFPLPSTMSKTKIKVLFTMQTLTVHVDNKDESTLPVSIPIPHYSAKALWAEINPSSSFWTWDREGEQKWGLLTLHMEKKHDGTRWMHVFNPSPRRPATTTSPELDLGSDMEMEVPETLDPSELWHIRESLEKYTTALRDGEDASGLGLGKGLSSLADGEMDEEVDANVGRRVCLTWVGGGMDTNEIVAREGADQDEEHFAQLLSTPLPGSIGIGEDMSLILKHDLDGTVFTLQSSTATTPPTPQWIHTSTYSALSFVLASKQDTRFTHHLPSSSDPNSPSGGAVLALEGGSSQGRGGNLYIYRSVPTNKEKWAKQVVLKVDDGLGGALLGVGCIKGKGGERIVVCLTEGELVLIQGI